MDDLNPYASPRVDTSLRPPEPEARGGWRDGDTLLLRRQGAVLPRACVKTNRSASVAKYDFFTFSNAWACLVLPMFFVPFIGFGLSGTVVCLLAVLGIAPRTRLWFRPGLIAILMLRDIVASGIGLTGNVLTGAGLLTGSLRLSVLGLLCSAIGVVLAVAPIPMMVYLRLDLVAPDLVRVRGVHPEYLSRLPQFEGQPITKPLDASRTHHP